MRIDSPWRDALAVCGFLALTACGKAPNADPASGDTALTAERDLPSWGEFTAWQCGDLRVETRVESGSGDRLQLALPGGMRLLEISVAASGARFSDQAVPGQPAPDQSETVFWNKGAEATLMIDGNRLQCQIAADRSPWAEAQERGAQLRAVGQEPGWVMTVETVAEGERMRLERMGQPAESWHSRRLGTKSYEAVEAVEAVEAAVIIEVEDRPCADTMSGEVFPVAVMVRINDETLHGCGRHYVREA